MRSKSTSLLPAITEPRARVAELTATGVRSIESRLVLAGTILLVLGVATDRYGVHVQGFNLRIELLVGAFLALAYVALAGIRRTLSLVKAMGLVEYCLAAWLLVSFIATLFFSPMRSESLKLTFLVAGFVVLYAVAFVLLRSERRVIHTALAWVGVGTAVALTGLIDALLYMTFGWENGITTEASYASGTFFLTPKVHSTLWEPNLFGSFCLTVGVLALALSCAPEFSGRWRLWLRFAATVAFCGEMLSMTRTLWLVTPLVLLLFAVVFLWRRIVGWRELLAGLIAPAVVGALIGFAVGYLMPSYSITPGTAMTPEQQQQVLSQLGNGSRDPLSAASTTSTTQAGLDKGVPGQVTSTSALGERVSSLSSLSDISSLTGRQRIFTLALHGWLEKPLLGWGTGSFAVYDPSEDKWIGNLELHILFDTGIVGFLLLAVAALWPVWRGIRQLRVAASGWGTTEYVVLGLLIAGFGLVLAYQTTEGLWLGFTWVFLAILVAAVRTGTSPVAQVTQDASKLSRP